MIVGITEGEYLPWTPSFTASWPFAPEYFGWSYFPPSSEKCRWPSPCFAGFPTFCGASLKLLSFTTTVTALPVIASFFGFSNATVAPGAPTFAAVELAYEDVLVDVDEVDFLLLPQPTAATATTGTQMSASALRVMDASCLG